MQDKLDDICSEAPAGRQICTGALLHSSVFSSTTDLTQSGMQFSPLSECPPFPTSKRLQEHQTSKKLIMGTVQ